MPDYGKLIDKRIKKLMFYINDLVNETDPQMKEMLTEYYEYELKYLKVIKRNLKFLAEYGCLEYPIIGFREEDD